MDDHFKIIMIWSKISNTTEKFKRIMTDLCINATE